MCIHRTFPELIQVCKLFDNYLLRQSYPDVKDRYDVRVRKIYADLGTIKWRPLVLENGRIEVEGVNHHDIQDKV